MKLIIISQLLLGQFLLYGNICSAALPSLDETEKFIAEQLFNIDPVSVSCKEIIIPYLNIYGRKRQLSFSPVEVKYKLHAAVDDGSELRKNDYVNAACIMSGCIKYFDSDGELVSTGLSQDLGSAVSASRFIKALIYHQDLCGGTKEQLF